MRNGISVEFHKTRGYFVVSQETGDGMHEQKKLQTPIFHILRLEIEYNNNDIICLLLLVNSIVENIYMYKVRFMESHNTQQFRVQFWYIFFDSNFIFLIN